jgi:hypothetical protein
MQQVIDIPAEILTKMCHNSSLDASHRSLAASFEQAQNNYLRAALEANRAANQCDPLLDPRIAPAWKPLFPHLLKLAKSPPCDPRGGLRRLIGF